MVSSWSDRGSGESSKSMSRTKSWFRITWSIRTLLLLMALAAVALAWQVPRWRRANAMKTLENLGAGLEGKNGEVKAVCLPSYGHGFGGTSATGVDGWKQPRRLISLIGDADTLESITIEPGDLRHHSLRPWLQLRKLRRIEIGNAALSKANLEVLAALPSLEFLSLSRTYLDSDSLEPFTKTKRLHTLWLINCDIGTPFDPNGEASRASEDGLESMASRQLREGQKRPHPHSFDETTLPIIGRMKSLQELRLSDLPVDTAKLEFLRSMESLKTLSLSFTDIDDSAVDVLLSLPQLEHVNAAGTGITRDGVLRFLRSSKKTKLYADGGKELMDLRDFLTVAERARLKWGDDEPFSEDP